MPAVTFINETQVRRLKPCWASQLLSFRFWMDFANLFWTSSPLALLYFQVPLHVALKHISPLHYVTVEPNGGSQTITKVGHVWFTIEARIDRGGEWTRKRKISCSDHSLGHQDWLFRARLSKGIFQWCFQMFQSWIREKHNLKEGPRWM